MTLHREPPSPSVTSVWVLLSGGIDSAACVAFYLQRGFKVECIHWTFGQAASVPEQAAAQRVANHYGVPLTILQWSGSTEFATGEIVGRNAFLLFGALMETGGQSGIMAMGVHAGTSYFDCTKTFVHLLQRVIDGYCDGTVQISAPFVDWSKHDIFQFCVTAGVPVELTYSCETGTAQPCGDCLSCRDRSALNAV